MDFQKSSEVEDILNSYPASASEKLVEIRSLIVDTAEELGVPKLLETTKWGEPSYVAKGGSTIRIDWKSKTPSKIFIYFICSTQLVSTFKFMLGEEMIFHGNRAIELDIAESLPRKSLKRCITLALTYHKVKDLPMLGV